DVNLAAVVAKPDEKWGETPCAFIELKPGASAAEDEIIGWCREHLARFKCPRRIEFMASLPRSEAGKILRRKVRDHYVEESA
ncbi:MAG: AMP-dependent synthetase, partial [Pseudomonadales bacterium]|nr:AMP-dependent synthetase [Pseudomonadales bacterium]